MSEPAVQRRRRPRIIPRRTPIPEQDPAVRRKNFNEVALGYTPELAVREAGRCLDCRKPLCVEGCPVQVPIPRFIGLVREGRFEEALAAVREANLLPAVCGRVCPQEKQCEERCTLGRKHEPVAVGRLERFVADRVMEQNRDRTPAVPAPTGRKAAVVGSGPAGLACAYELARFGHQVTIYEAFHEPGGVLLYGIPEFRLPKRIVSREISVLARMGVEIVKNAVVGRLITLDELLERHHACFVATGAGTPRFMGIEGEDLNGVYSANEFLTRMNFMRAYAFPEYDTPVRRGARVAVVGGGNVAMDSVRTALRLGASDCCIVYRRTEEEMPARREEVLHAREEGVRFELCTEPSRIIGRDGAVRELECLRMQPGRPDGAGRTRPVPAPGSAFRIPVDMVIMAIGTNANPLVTQSARDLAVHPRGYIIADPETGRTSRAGVFAGGDIVTGSATVILALGTGRRVARAMDAYLASASSR